MAKPQQISRILTAAGFKRSEPYPGRTMKSNWSEGFKVERVDDTIVRVEWRLGSIDYRRMEDNEYFALRDGWLEKFRHVLRAKGYEAELAGDQRWRFLRVE